MPGYSSRMAARQLARADARLAPIIEQVGPPRLRRRSRDAFDALVRAIVYQQLSGHAAGAIYARVCALFAAREPEPRSLLALPEARLRAAGLSAAKTAALRDLAAKTLDGVVPPPRSLSRLDDESIVRRLTQVRGVGRWTVEMLLIFHLRRPDVLPVDDLGVRKGCMLIDGLAQPPRPRELAARAEPWRPYRSIASWYLWRAAELGARNPAAGGPLAG